jgi:hypothetical protein
MGGRQMDETKKSVDNLQEQIEKTQVEGEKSQKLAEIKKSIDLLDSDTDGKQHQTLKEQLEDALLHFDAEHHALVIAMQNTINSLSNSGV